MTIIKPSWVTRAHSYLDVKEVPGAGNNPVIVGWLIKLKAWWRDDLQPWCGTFIAACMSEVGIPLPKAWYRAKAYLDWGVPLEAPCYGCVVVFTRTGGGHVGFVVGRDPKGRLIVLGGNQGDRVSLAPFDMSRVSGYRWPPGVPVNRQELPVIESAVASSRNEA
jgi:uncharacterized protein (TIGR02594 family)